MPVHLALGNLELRACALAVYQITSNLPAYLLEFLIQLNEVFKDACLKLKTFQITFLCD